MAAKSPMKQIFAAGLVAALVGAPLYGVVPALADEITNFAPGGIAIRGTDPVAYFSVGKAVAGSDAFSAEYDDVIWKFSSAENRAAFLADPVKYAPQYGGYCAYAMSLGYKVPTDPEQWNIIDGKLYLNNGPAAKRSFLKDPQGAIARADINWPKVMNLAAN